MTALEQLAKQMFESEPLNRGVKWEDIVSEAVKQGWIKEARYSLLLTGEWVEDYELDAV